MPCRHFTIGDSPGIACLGGPTLRLVVNGVTIPFEMHAYCGPMPLNKKGDPKNLGPRHPFWRVVSLWAKQGQRVDDSGLCIWDDPRGESSDAI